VGRRARRTLSILLDTHALVWWFSGASDRLSAAAAAAIGSANRVLVSPISCWEVAMLLRSGRIELDRPLGLWIARLTEDPRCDTAPLSPAAAAWAGSIDDSAFPGDPADRMILATARDLRVPLVTKDERLHRAARSLGDVRVIW
jgi:PIN domain nuclease of toxin-antitoxin system